MDQKSRLLPLLIITAAASVVAFSSIGIAAITGNLSIARSSLNPFSAFGGAPTLPSSGFNRVISGLTHEGLTRGPGETTAYGKPVNFRPGARVPARKSSCPNCGVVDSIKPQQANGDDGKLAAALGTAGRAYQVDNDELSFVVIVRMENGTVRTIHENQRPPFSIGERVKLVNGTVIPLG
jgi:outer membrane lipoprotein SlyB